MSTENELVYGDLHPKCKLNCEFFTPCNPFQICALDIKLLKLQNLKDILQTDASQMSSLNIELSDNSNFSKKYLHQPLERQR